MTVVTVRPRALTVFATVAGPARRWGRAGPPRVCMAARPLLLCILPATALSLCGYLSGGSVRPPRPPPSLSLSLSLSLSHFLSLSLCRVGPPWPDVVRHGPTWSDVVRRGPTVGPPRVARPRPAVVHTSLSTVTGPSQCGGYDCAMRLIGEPASDSEWLPARILPRTVVLALGRSPSTPWLIWLGRSAGESPGLRKRSRWS